MILVTGATGFVGSKILKSCKNTIACPSLRNATEDDIKRIIFENPIDTIIHTAAIADIGECEKNPEESYLANVQIPIYLARASKGIKLICFSSDQVYSGFGKGGPFTEEKVKPGNLYAKHKLEMENRVLEIDPNAVMLRAQWMYDYYLKKSNYLMGILNENQSVCYSSRQFRGITYLKEVAQNMEAVAKLEGGAYNFGSETTKSMYEITKEFLASIGKKISLVDNEYENNLWVDCTKAKKGGVIFNSVEDGLRECARDYGLLK